MNLYHKEDMMLSFDFLNSLYLHHNLSFRSKVRFSFVGQYTENEIFAA